MFVLINARGKRSCSRVSPWEEPMSSLQWSTRVQHSLRLSAWDFDSKGNSEGEPERTPSQHGGSTEWFAGSCRHVCCKKKANYILNFTHITTLTLSGHEQLCLTNTEMVHNLIVHRMTQWLGIRTSNSSLLLEMVGNKQWNKHSNWATTVPLRRPQSFRWPFVVNGVGISNIAWGHKSMFAEHTIIFHRRPRK